MSPGPGRGTGPDRTPLLVHASQVPGGFCVGPVGTPGDAISADLASETDWSTGEYWLVPLANTCQALSILLPSRVSASRKLG